MIFIDFLFKDLISIYKKLFLSNNLSQYLGFRFEKHKTISHKIGLPNPNSDMREDYQEFMFQLLKVLEPTRLESNTIM